MSAQPVSPAITPLRRRMLEDMAMRGLRTDTQRDYIRFVKSFAAFLRRSPDTASAEDIRRFQVHQAESGVQPQSINCSVSALRFFFTVTLDRPDLSRRFVIVRYPQKLPTVLNVEEVGRLLEIPAQDDSPPFFTMKKSRPDHVAEVLSVLVTPTPLEGVQITDKAQKLTETQLATWEKNWGGSVGRLEMTTQGQTWTKEEKDSNTRALTASAPAPQLLFYRPSVKPAEPMFVKLRLNYRR